MILGNIWALMSFDTQSFFQAHQHLVTARALETSPLSPSKPPFEVLDWSALVSALRIAAGLPGFDSAKVSLPSDWLFPESHSSFAASMEAFRRLDECSWPRIDCGLQ
jgi:hypothetical protein